MGKKYIDADCLKQTIADNVYLVQDAFNSRDYGMFWTGGIEKAIDEQPAVDVIEVVRCADCKYQEKGDNDCEAWNLCGYRPWLYIPTEDDAFCSKGERKDG